MIVTITRYDSIKGTGVYRTSTGTTGHYNYKQLYCEEAIPVGAKARVKGQKIYPYYTLWQHIKDIIQEVLDKCHI